MNHQIIYWHRILVACIRYRIREEGLREETKKKGRFFQIHDLARDYSPAAFWLFYPIARAVGSLVPTSTCRHPYRIILAHVPPGPRANVHSIYIHICISTIRRTLGVAIARTCRPTHVPHIYICTCAYIHICTQHAYLYTLTLALNYTHALRSIRRCLQQRQQQVRAMEWAPLFANGYVSLSHISCVCKRTI